tara:strand:- start:5061 stop:6296 length:1236 start_codon:yes stop_codon:yes gene_type:complete
VSFGKYIDPMHIAVVTNFYPPQTNSAANQLCDLVTGLIQVGHRVTLFVATEEDCEKPVSTKGLLTIIRIRVCKMARVNYIQRLFAEWTMPLLMKRWLLRSNLCCNQWDGIIWYSPSIFLGPFIRHIKNKSRCPAYLILRDIFPQWCLDLQILKPGWLFNRLNAVAWKQYQLADVIGIQSFGNSVFLQSTLKKNIGQVEVLHNWLGRPLPKTSSIQINQTALKGRKILVYAGNMGVAQGFDQIIELASTLVDRKDIGFLLVGQGKDVNRLRKRIAREKIDNTLIFDAIVPQMLPDLYRQCAAGLISLDVRHTTHNIPGKFLSYLQAGLPIFALVNPGNDLVHLIKSNQVGVACTSDSLNHLIMNLNQLLSRIECEDFSKRCQALYQQQYTPQRAVKQIMDVFLKYRDHAHGK